MFDLSKSFFLSPPTFGLPLPLFRGSSSRLCLVLSDIDHSNSLRSTLVSRSTLSPSFSSPSSIHLYSTVVLSRSTPILVTPPKCRFPLCYSSPKFNLTPTLSCEWICPSLVVKTQAQTCRIRSRSVIGSPFIAGDTLTLIWKEF